MARKHIKIPSPRQVRAIREALGMTQADFADKIGVGQAVVAGWETGKRKPSHQSALLIDLLKRGKLDD